MATHVKKVSNGIKYKLQIFTDDTSDSNAYTFASNDIIDIKNSLGREAKGLLVIVSGTNSYTCTFNYDLDLVKFNESQADDVIQMPNDLSGINTMRFVSVANQERQYRFDFPITSILINAFTGSASGSNHIHFIVW